MGFPGQLVPGFSTQADNNFHRVVENITAGRELPGYSTSGYPAVYLKSCKFCPSILTHYHIRS